jgi:rhamnosyltransferase
MSGWLKLSDSSEPPAGEIREFAIGFVTYRPDGGFYDRVPLACELGHEVFVFDNAPESTDHPRLNAGGNPRLHYSTAGKNLGLGIGLSAVCASAYAHGCKQLLFFDQDTRFTAETLNYVKSFLQQQGGLVDATHASVTFQAPRGDDTDHRPVDTLLAISSGSLFLLRNVAAMGWHNPKYFVDGVDYEFCLRARARQLRVAICSGAPGFDHVSDQADSTHEVFGRPMRLRKYPWSRVLDSLSAYVRLAFVSLGRLDMRGFFSVMRSLAIFVGGQSLARIFIRGKN